MSELGINKAPDKTRVVVAMSGGVDSSTVAALLVEQNYQVIGITLQLYDLAIDTQKKGACCAGQDIYDAKLVADKLKIPHYVLDYETLFKQSVIEDFADSYLRGETPIPCIRCNQSVKFRDLFTTAKDLGADALVTGHYVRRINGINGAQLHRAIDHKKDQSYFLFATTQAQLDFLYFPLGTRTKEQTRELAKRYQLITADKPDSQDICFVPNGSYTNIIEKLRPGSLDSGEIITIDGQILGRHNGIINYTIGQRKGLNINDPKPWYVLKIDPINKQVIVGRQAELNNILFIIKEVNWLLEEEVELAKLELTVKLRSSHQGVRATIKKLPNNQAEVTLINPERAITPGQACVVYHQDRLIAGGWITRQIN